MGVLEKIFGNRKPIEKYVGWSEIGSFRAQFTSFGTDVYKSDLVRACIRPLAEHTSKANVTCTDKNIERILKFRPNYFMNGKDFLEKARTLLEVTNNLFIMIQREEGRISGFYPVPYQTYTAVEYGGEIYIKFRFPNPTRKELVVPWADLIVLHKDYLNGDISGEQNTSILGTLDLIHTTNEGVGNAIKSTSNLRGIIKSTKANLKNDDVVKMKNDFVNDYMNISNEGGIAALDASMDFIPVKMEPVFADEKQMNKFREDVYRYFGVSDAIITADFDEDQMQAFYEARIEPFLLALSLEMTSKIFSKERIARGAEIVFSADRMQFASMQTKLSLVQLVDRGAMTPNEWRQVLNLSPIDGGDVPIRRLDTVPINEKGESENKE